MSVRMYRDGERFVAAHSASWLRDEAACGVLLRYKRGVQSAGVLRLAVADEQGDVHLTAIVAVDDQVVLSPGPDEAVAHLAGWLVERAVDPPGIFGERSTALRFAKSFGPRTAGRAGTATGERGSRRAGARFETVKELLHEELGALRAHTRSPGRLRPAKPSDAGTLVEFADASQAEGNTQRHFDSTARVAEELDAGQLFVWETHPHGVVAAAGLYLDRSPRSGFVDGVYTLPAHRGRGIATSLVGALTRRILDAGRVPALSVDAENAAAIRVYERLGYEERCRMANLRRA